MEAPDIIYLQTCGSCPNYKIDIKECENYCRFEDLAEVTWSQDRINETDRVYFSEEKVMDLLTTIFHSDRAEEILTEMKGGKE